MKKIIFYSLLALMIFPTSSWALSCAVKDGAEDVIPQNELIVKAKVLDIKTAPNIPLIREEGEGDSIVTFEIVDLYNGPEKMPATFKAHFSNFYQKWGPHLEVGNTGEYLFSSRKLGGWDYAGPGGCNYYSEKAWQVLREKAHPIKNPAQ